MFGRLFGRKPEPFITVVSGLPRSGTSMMMKMLDAGGIPPMQDGVRSADTDNPKGYFEFERVKQLDKGDVAWLGSAENKAVKIITFLLLHLPRGYNFKVIMMRRDLDEVLASQSKMLDRRGEKTTTSDDEMKELYNQHLSQVYGFIERHPTMTYIDVDYNEMATDPVSQLPAIKKFLGSDLDIAAMAMVSDPSLYRNRVPQN